MGDINAGEIVSGFLSGYLQGRDRKEQLAIQEEERSFARERMEMERSRFQMDQNKYEHQKSLRPLEVRIMEYNAKTAELNNLITSDEYSQKSDYQKWIEQKYGEGHNQYTIKEMRDIAEFEAMMDQRRAALATEGLQQRRMKQQIELGDLEIADYPIVREQKEAQRDLLNLQVRGAKADLDNAPTEQFKKNVDFLRNNGLILDPTKTVEGVGLNPADVTMESQYDPDSLRLNMKDYTQMYADGIKQIQAGDTSPYTLQQTLTYANAVRQISGTLLGLDVESLPIVTPQDLPLAPTTTPEDAVNMLVKVSTTDIMGNTQPNALVPPSLIAGLQDKLDAYASSAFTGIPVAEDEPQQGAGVPQGGNAEPLILDDKMVRAAIENSQSAENPADRLDESFFEAYKQLKKQRNVVFSTDFEEIKRASDEIKAKNTKAPEEFLSQVRSQDPDLADALEFIMENQPGISPDEAIRHAREMAGRRKAERGEKAAPKLQGF